MIAVDETTENAMKQDYPPLIHIYSLLFGIVSFNLFYRD